MSRSPGPQLNEAMDTDCLNSLIAASFQDQAPAGGPLWSPAKGSAVGDPPALCPTCGVVIQNAANVEVHMKRHLAYKPYSCSLCNAPGYDEDDVRRHAARSHHGRSAPSIRFAPDPAQERALQELTQKSRRSFVATSPEAAALSIDTGDGRDLPLPAAGSLACRLCGKSVEDLPLSVIRHLKSHLSCPAYACPSCGLTTPSWAEMTRHAASAHGHLSPASPNPPIRKALTSLALAAFPGQLPQVPCALCSGLVEWSEGSLGEHLRHHSSYVPYKCGECGSAFSCTANAGAHIAAEHPGIFPSLIYMPEVEDEHRQLPVFEVAFPILSADSLEALEPEEMVAAPVTPSEPLTMADDADSALSFSPSPDKAMIECRQCGNAISRNMSCLIAHAKVHLAYKPLHCELCNFKHFAMSKVRRHTARVHPKKPVKVSYHPVGDIGRQIKEMKQRCFGSQASSTSWPEARAASRASNAPETQDDSPAPSEDSGLPAFSPGQAASRLLDALVSASGGNNRNTTRHYDERPDAPRKDSESGADLLGLGKKACLLCRTFIANNASSFDNHACKHLDYKPYHCQYCQYQSYIRGKVTRHIQQVHAGCAIKIAHRPEPGIKERIAAIKLRCFPFITEEEAMDSKPCDEAAEEVPCILCQDGTTVPAAESAMDEHLQNHITEKFYHCPVCTYQTTFLIRAKQHVHSAHPQNQETRILCCPPDGLKGLKEMRLRCFGAAAVGAARSGVGENWDAMDEDDEDDEIPAPTPATPAAPTGRITCSLCRASLSNQPATIASHVKNHLSDYKPHQCAYCPHKGAEESEVKEHILSAHKSVPLSVLYQPQPAQLARMADICFPEFKGEMGALMEASTLAGGVGGFGSPFSGRSTPSAAKTAENRTPTPATSSAGQTGPGCTLLKKLICQLCKNTIADNPKSIGIHVKNHLNYKPYRCPFCRYMSCEQSKARRHVEHVHSVSGDMVEIHAEEGIKERIAEMKGRCFPAHLTAAAAAAAAAAAERAAAESPPDDPVSMVPPPPAYGAATAKREDSPPESGSDELLCHLCQTMVPAATLMKHIEGHLGPFLPFRCPDCPDRFESEEVTREHLKAEHPDTAAAWPVLDAEYWTPEGHAAALKETAFPQLLAPTDDDGRETPMKTSAEGKLTCRVCEQWVSCNPHSLDVHAKTHLAFKQHTCGHCSYRSCISGKVKRHLDNVHKGLEPRMSSLTDLPASVKQIVADMRTACFPQVEPGADMSLTPRTKAAVSRLVETLKTRLVEDLTEMGEASGVGEEDDEERPKEDKALALATALSMGVGGRPPSAASPFPGLMGLDEEDEESGKETPSESGGIGKLQCQLCRIHVADNPSSLGLHVRNHLDYKPFSCNLCDYKSCIQAKVKRHLRNVHKCATLEMTYAPETDIRLKVQDMKSRCFPRIIEAAESAQNGGLGPLPPGSSAFGGAGPRDVNEMLDTMLGGDGTGGSLMAAISAMAGPRKEPPRKEPRLEAASSSPASPLASSGDLMECRLCARRLRSVDREAHVRRHHAAESQWHCSECGEASFLEANVKSHAETAHPGTAAQPVRFESGGPLGPDALQRLAAEAFAPAALPSADADEALDMDEDESEEEPSRKSTPSRNVTDGPRYICHKCGQAVSMYASSLYVHVKNHMGYKPYGCRYCDYRSPVKSKVRRHISNAHKGQPQAIDFSPVPGIESQIARMKKECFPDVTSSGPPKDTGDKVPCSLCRLDVADSAGGKAAHAKSHLDPRPYHCGLCSFAAAHKASTRKHCAHEHPGQPLRITYRPEEDADEHRLSEQIVQLCFGPPLGSALPPPPPKVEEEPQTTPGKVRLGPAFREWHCPYCLFSDTSKYNVKEHCVSSHPGQSICVSDVALKA